MSVCPDVSDAPVMQAHEGSTYLKVTEPPGKDVFRGEKDESCQVQLQGQWITISRVAYLQAEDCIYI